MGLRFQGLKVMVKSLGCRVKACKVMGSEFGVLVFRALGFQGYGFRVCGLGVWV